MILHLSSGHWLIDARGPSTSAQLSLDLAQHLPRRISSGNIVVVTKNPKIFLSVIRKRWRQMVYEAEMQRSCTCSPLRRKGLQYEIDRMKNCIFSAKPLPKTPKNTQVFFIDPKQIFDTLPEHTTLYIATPLTSKQALAALRWTKPGGLAVIYGEWTIEYEVIMQRSFEQYQTV